MLRDNKGRFIKAPKMVSPAKEAEKSSLADLEFWVGLAIVAGLMSYTFGYFG